MNDRGEHTETATRAGDLRRLIVEGWSAWATPYELNEHDAERLRQRLDDFAAAVRAEEREQIAQAIEVMELTSAWNVRDHAARLARGSS